MNKFERIRGKERKFSCQEFIENDAQRIKIGRKIHPGGLSGRSVQEKCRQVYLQQNSGRKESAYFPDIQERDKVNQPYIHVFGINENIMRFYSSVYDAGLVNLLQRPGHQGG